MAQSKANPAAVLRQNRETAIKIAGDVGVHRLIGQLEAAQKNLNKRLEQSVGLKGAGSNSFTAEQLRVTLVQVRDVLEELRGGMTKTIVGTGKSAGEAAAHGQLEYLQRAEKKYRGINARLPIREAAMFDRVRNGVESSILHRISNDPKHPGHPGVLSRYGGSVIASFEEKLQQRFLARQPWAEVRQALVDESPFLQSSPRYWAERIVRTETMNAYNRAGWETTRASDDVLGDMVKILCATFDDRTGADSYAVHGQIRRSAEAFESWFGLYQHPPNRPNDREVVVPHRVSWPLPDELKWKTDAEVVSRWAQEGRKGSPPRRPKMTTVDVALFGKEKPPPPNPEALVPEQTAQAPTPTPEQATGSPLAQLPAALAKPPEAEIPQDVQALPSPRAVAAAVAEPPPEIQLPPAPELLSTGAPKPPKGLKKAEKLVWSIEQIRALPKSEIAGCVIHGIPSPPKPPSALPPYAHITQIDKIGAGFSAIESGSAKPKKIQIAKLQAWDPEVDLDSTLNKLIPSEKKTPVVIKFQGKMWIHRGLSDIVAEKFSGKLTVSAHVIDLDKPEPKPKGVHPPPPEVKKVDRKPHAEFSAGAAQTYEELKKSQKYLGHDYFETPHAEVDAHKRLARAESDNLRPEERTAIVRFTQGYDFTIRLLERGKSREEVIAIRRAYRRTKGDEKFDPYGGTPEKHVDEAIEAMQGLAKMFARVKPHTAVKHVYRGIGKLSREQFDRFLTDDTFRLGASSSTSYDSGTAMAFMTRDKDRPYRVLFKLRQRSGIGIEFDSRYNHEAEILMPPNARFRVTNRRLLDNDSVIIEAEEI